MREWVVPATVLSIHDGDTLTVQADLGWYIQIMALHVRVAHINSPELTTPKGKKARDYLRGILKIGDVVTLTSHSLEKYGRTLGSVTLPDGRDLATLMVESGNAVPYEGHAS
jgi:micrococcal nuclease